jgi:hypothetical protein
MRGLNAADILQVWDLGLSQHSLDRAMTILSAGCPELSYADLLALPIGLRDAHLLMVYALTFGAQIQGRSRCPGCQEQIEFALDTADLLISPGESPSSGVLEAGDYDVTFRLPTSLDLAAIAGLDNVAEARLLLASRCVISATYGGAGLEAGELPENVLSVLAEEMARQDPQAAIELDLRCPTCATQWQAVFDIVDQFWAQIVATARRLMVEVHRLAATYGWREQDILAMSPARRGIYLEMAG